MAHLTLLFQSYVSTTSRETYVVDKFLILLFLPSKQFLSLSLARKQERVG